jgi:hypothetical protein
MSNDTISVNLALQLVKNGFQFVRTNDLGKTRRICDECGHKIRYEQVFMDLTCQIEYNFGSDCMFKIYILEQWENDVKEENLENSDLQRAGKWLWVISRDGYADRIEIPKPSDFDNNYKELADHLKREVMRVRVEIRKENEKQRSEEERKNRVYSQSTKILVWLERAGINWNACNEWEKDFLSSIYSKRIQYGCSLTDKQKGVYQKIKENKNRITEDYEEEKQENQDTIELLEDVQTKDELLNGWEQEFIESVIVQSKFGRNLTESQWKKINEIVEKISKDESLNKYVGKKISSWLMERLDNTETRGIILTTTKETEKAVLCTYNNPETKQNTTIEIWIPKSQIKDD